VVTHTAETCFEVEQVQTRNFDPILLPTSRPPTLLIYAIYSSRLSVRPSPRPNSWLLGKLREMGFLSNSCSEPVFERFGSPSWTLLELSV
jgi:hypothetical protein